MSGVDLHVERWGERGQRVLLVHGSVMNGPMTWAEQRPLAERWQLIVLNRRGYFPNPPVAREDFDVDAGDVAELLGEAGGVGMHLVGHSYGGVIALLAAARRPEAVRSLTVIEPPAFGAATGDPRVAAFDARAREYWRSGPRDPEAFLRGFLELAGSSAQIPTPLPPPLAQNALLLMNERNPAEAVIPLEELRRAAFPKLVVSGGHNVAFDKVCDVIQEEIEAQRVVIRGSQHSAQRTGGPFNVRLEAFMRAADRAAAAAA